MSESRFKNMRAVLSSLGISTPESDEDIYDAVLWGRANRILRDIFHNIDIDKKQLEAHEATIAELQEENKWISVDDRLPEELCDIYLVQCLNDGDTYFRTALWLREAGWQAEHRVTHWKPINSPDREV